MKGTNSAYADTPTRQDELPDAAAQAFTQMVLTNR